MAVDRDMRILVVDDFENIGRTLKSQLRQLGFTKVEVAASGTAALEKIKETKDYGLILADWIMPDVNGLALLKEVRGDPKLKGVPFIMVTGNTDPEDVTAAKKAGVSNYIIKPYNMATLKQRLEATLGALN